MHSWKNKVTCEKQICKKRTLFWLALCYCECSRYARGPALCSEKTNFRSKYVIGNNNKNELEGLYLTIRKTDFQL